jgi:opacity protein-like surface antigen
VNKFLVTLIGAFSVAACGAASAADMIIITPPAVDVLPWYVSGKVGIALPGTIESTSTTAFGVGGSGTSTFDAGFAGAVAVGKYFTPELRGEVELGLASNAGRSFEGTDAFGFASSGTLTGNVTTTTLMVGGAYDFTQFGDFVPYLSGGLGIAHVNTDLTLDDTTGFASGTITGASTVFAARAGVGFEYKLTDAVSFTTDYTVLVGGEVTSTHTDLFGTESTVTSNLMGHALAVGIRGSF